MRGKIQIDALDKTGTVTEGKPKSYRHLSCGTYGDDELLLLAYSLEWEIAHARAVKEKAEERHESGRNFRIPGSWKRPCRYGRGTRFTAVGNLYLPLADIPQDMTELSGHWGGEGKTPIFFERNGILQGL